MDLKQDGDQILTSMSLQLKDSSIKMVRLVIKIEHYLIIRHSSILRKLFTRRIQDIWLRHGHLKKFMLEEAYGSMITPLDLQIIMLKVEEEMLLQEEHQLETETEVVDLHSIEYH